MARSIGRNPGESEETGLHDRIDAAAQSRVAGDAIGIDDVDPEALVEDLGLDFTRKVIPDPVGSSGAFNKKMPPGAAYCSTSQRSRKSKLMAGQKPRLPNERGRAELDGGSSEMRDRHRAGFARIVHEVALHPAVRAFTDNLDRVLVGADRSVGAESEEHGSKNLRRFNVELGIHR